ncbi:PAS domain-containing sensor histidine kinase [Alkaliphilus transvaalensis]|uniref:PAS domain-containing sensor histidine kinase n=1 Tax=Alkaliphilus transvaalensis TaxID=114628 RepID=UPI00068620F0|nr:PAS domain-containing sensor histidine kinase [Alkaliphilus transvaalensis]
MGYVNSKSLEKVLQFKNNKIQKKVIIYILILLITNIAMILTFNNKERIFPLIITKITFFILFLIGFNRYLIKINNLKNKLDTYEEKYKFVINNTTEGLWDWNLQTGIVMLPKKWKETLGYKDDEIPNSVVAWENLIHPEDFQWVAKKLEDYLDRTIPEYNVEYRMLNKNNEVVWIHDKGQAIWDHDGIPIRIVGTHTDITYRKKAESTMLKMIEENQKLLAQTLQQERRQAEFFSNISHEFKTPLNVILGSIQLLELMKNSGDGLDVKKLDKTVYIMRQNCYRLLRLINNLLDSTKLDYNAFNIKYKNFNIIYILEEITQSTIVLAQNKGVTITFDTDVEERYIACDINIIERIMLNLLSNAIKSTKWGDEIQVTVNNTTDYILVTVKDTGIGIPKNKINKIFDRYIQADESFERTVEGCGIGLSLVKSFVEKLEGELWVESEEGVGSQFFIKLPVKVLEEENSQFSYENYTNMISEQINVEFSDIYQKYP